jgi:hypothetical protein
MADLTHLATLVAGGSGPREDGAEFDHWGGPPVDPAVRTLHGVWATGYVERLGRHPGEAAGYLHGLRYETPDVDPWRLLEQVAEQALARQPRKDG